MTRKNEPPVMHEIEVHLHLASEKAWMLSRDGAKENACWWPKSQCELTGKAGAAPRQGQVATLTAPEWLIHKNRWE